MRFMVLCLLAAACSPNTVQTPTRSLDAPSDLALVCAARTEQGTVVLPKAQCRAADQGAILGDGGIAAGQLFALVSNTNRGEVALTTVGATALGSFSSSGATIVDLDPSTPGFGFLPVGQNPAHLRATEDGCLAVTANRDSCDLAVIDTVRLLGAKAGDRPGPDFPSQFVRRVQPKAAGAPLSARPTWIEMAPAHAGESGAVGSGAGGGGITGATAEACDVPPRRALVAFPNCELVAELDLGSGEIVHALKVTRNGATPIAPTAIQCPAECAGAAVDAGLPVDAAGASDGGAVDGAVADAGLPSRLPQSQALPATLAVDGVAKRVYIGDAASARITVASIGDDGGLGMAGAILLAEQPAGVEVVRLSPRIAIPSLAAPSDPGVQYLFAIARDRTVRVVNADNGVECETNPDPRAIDEKFAALAVSDPGAVAQALRCLPIGGPETPPRSELATGPGIALPGGALPRDLAFVHLEVPTDVMQGQAASANPSLLVGDFALAIDSSGRAEVINLVDRCPQPNNAARGASPLSACVPSVRAPSIAEAASFVGRPEPAAIDFMPNRLRNANLRFQAPQNASDPGGSPRLNELPTISVGGTTLDFNDPTHANLCNLPAPNGADGGVVGCTSLPAAVSGSHLIAFHDPVSVRNENWFLAWEGVVPGTTRDSGRVGASLLSDPAGGYCNRGVEAGDRLFLLGCTDDSSCAPDQLCFRDSASPEPQRGLCLPRDPVRLAQAKVACQPWTRAVRRYRIREVFGRTLSFDELPLPEHPVDTVPCNTDADCAAIQVPGTSGIEKVSLPTVCLPIAGGVKQCLRACSLTGTTDGTGRLCSEGFVCTQSQFDPQGKTRCLRATLPPSDLVTQSLCFGSNLLYEVHAGEAFLVRGDATSIPSTWVTDSATDRCVASPAHGPLLSRLRGRLPIDTLACPASVSLFDWLAPLPPAGPNACRISTEDATRRFLRFENPIFSLVVQVPSRSFGAEPVGGDGGTADGGIPLSGSSRVPADDTLMAFSIVGGFRALSPLLGIDSFIAQMARTAVVGPDGASVYVVDQGKQGTAAGLRGQVLRLLAGTQVVDKTFQIR